ncbi:unnamed protein product [Cylindrotheca closterium]|uniref:Uncharacterized protein n=1 Tax=Cylindrotheca closterium TaxID=2856 RepID=A0AAD2CD91_9STRA|nr:unnamed protein product [Cylindrotheca closterium]
MKDSITNPPKKDPNSIMTVADQGQGGLEAKTRSNLTTQSSIALTKDNPAITTPKRKQPPPSKTAEDGAVQGQSPVAYITKLKVSQFCRLDKTAWRQEVFALATAQRVITTDKKSPRFWEFLLVFDPTLIVQFPAINPHIVEEFERLKGEPTLAKAQSKFKKRLASTPANLKGAKAHDSPKNLIFILDTPDFFVIAEDAFALIDLPMVPRVKNGWPGGRGQFSGTASTGLWWGTITDSSPPDGQSMAPRAVVVGDVDRWRQARLWTRWSATGPSVALLGELSLAIGMASGSTHP